MYLEVGESEREREVQYKSKVEDTIHYTNIQVIHDIQDIQPLFC